MGLEDRGRIAEGAVADLLVVDGDPTTEIDAAADRNRHRRVMKAGLVVADRERRGTASHAKSK